MKKVSAGDVGNYFTRSKPFGDGDPSFITNIVVIDKVNPDGSFSVYATRNCQKNGSPIEISADRNDGGWYDITELVYIANSTIPHSPSIDRFESATAMMYRNYTNIAKKINPLSIQDAVGRVCIIGRRRGNAIVFNKCGEHIVGYDDNDFIITYYGFCSSTCDDDSIELRIIRLDASSEALYLASEVVTAANDALAEDMHTASEMVASAKANIIPPDSVQTYADTVLGEQLKTMHLSS